MNLSIKIFISLVLAVIVGLIAGEPALPFINWWIAPIGTIFINLIKMMIVPVVLCSLVVGMTSLGDTTKLGRIGIKTILLYLVTTAIAIVIGFGVAGLAHPGVGLQMTSDAVVKVKEAPSIMQVFVAMIPANPVASMAKADILPVIVFALFIGVGILKEIGDQKCSINRSKGLGENDPDMMWLTTMNPETRRLIKVEPEDVTKMETMFNLLLGNDEAGRKRHISEHGKEYLDQLDLQ